MYKTTHKTGLGLLIASCLILVLGTMGGFLFSGNALGEEPAFRFAQFGIFFSVFAVSIKLYLYLKAKNSLFYQLIFIGTIGFDLAWFASCCFLPLLWAPSVAMMVKGLALVGYIVICYCNFILAITTFKSKWRECGDATFEKKYDASKRTVDWEAILKKMQLTVIIHVPGMPKKFMDLFTLLMFLFLILGFVLRKIEPIWSMTALSMPCAVCAACCMQMTGYRFAEAQQVRLIEKIKQLKLKPM